jgi:predicted alpha/beta hydrolase family esterase
LNKRILILHGLGGSDFPHWQAQLASDLIKENYIVSFPAFPDRENPKLEEWKEFLKKELGHFKILKEEASSAGVRRIKAILE